MRISILLRLCTFSEIETRQNVTVCVNVCKIDAIAILNCMYISCRRKYFISPKLRTIRAYTKWPQIWAHVPYTLHTVYVELYNYSVVYPRKFYIYYRKLHWMDHTHTYNLRDCIIQSLQPVDNK